MQQRMLFYPSIESFTKCEGEVRWRDPFARWTLSVATLKTTQGQINGFFSQLLFNCYLPDVASVGD